MLIEWKCCCCEPLLESFLLLIHRGAGSPYAAGDGGLYGDEERDGLGLAQRRDHPGFGRPAVKPAVSDSRRPE
jgi:hypothetical protein